MHIYAVYNIIIYYYLCKRVFFFRSDVRELVHIMKTHWYIVQIQHTHQKYTPIMCSVKTRARLCVCARAAANGKQPRCEVIRRGCVPRAPLTVITVVPLYTSYAAAAATGGRLHCATLHPQPLGRSPLSPSQPSSSARRPALAHASPSHHPPRVRVADPGSFVTTVARLPALCGRQRIPRYTARVFPPSTTVRDTHAAGEGAH